MALAHIEGRAKRMRRRRRELRLTQEQVADRMQDIHRERQPDDEPDRTRGQMVSDWERAVNEPSAPKLELLAAALEWTVADLNADEPDKTETPDVLGDLTSEQISERLSQIERRLDELVAFLRDETVEELQEDEAHLAEQAESSDQPSARTANGAPKTAASEQP